ncbi:regulatory protein GemA [Hypericibacter sp.]|uniref:regulatory protein GemA n=1 Tax=Hypericibacter sp. TaxID=2705401 RepID=UPI003D6D3C40
MNLVSKAKIGLIHVAKAKLGLGDDDYRAILRQVAGVESSTALDEAGFDLVMLHFEKLGFKSDWGQRNFGHRAGMATPNQVALIRHLWSDYTAGEGTDASLGKWLDRRFKVSSVRFLDADAARKAIAGLRNMTQRRKAGHDPKTAA